MSGLSLRKEADEGHVVFAHGFAHGFKGFEDGFVAACEDFVVYDGAGDGGDDVEHFGAVFFFPFFAFVTVVRAARAIRGVVIAAHLEVGGEVVAHPFVCCGLMGCKSRCDARIGHGVECFVKIVPLFCGIPVIDYAAVDVGAACAQFDGCAEPFAPGVGSAAFDADLCEPLDAAAFIPVFFKEAHDVVVGAPKEGVDAEFFGLSPGVFDADRGVIIGHFFAAFSGLVREPAERVAANTEARDADATYICVSHVLLLYGRIKPEKKSLPLSSTTMNAGKFSTSMCHIASMPSSGYSWHSTLRMASLARRAAGPPMEPR